MEESKVIKILLAMLLALLLVCTALVANAQDRTEQPRPTVTQEVNWYLFQGYVLDATTNQVRGSYTVTRVAGDRQSQDGFLLITIGTRDGAWLVIAIRGSVERPKWQVMPATGLGSLSRWQPKGWVLEVGDVRWALGVRGTLEEVQ